MRRPVMKKGLTRRGPFSCSVNAVSAMPSRPPMPEPIIVPVRHFSSSVEGRQPASSSACLAAATAKTMKSSTRFDSFGSIQSSGLNAPSPSRGTGMAILQGRSETSNFSIFRAPDSPFRTRFHVVSTPLPSGDTIPKPVTTTRLMPMLAPTSNRKPGGIRKVTKETEGRRDSSLRP